MARRRPPKISRYEDELARRAHLVRSLQGCSVDVEHSTQKLAQAFVQMDDRQQLKLLEETEQTVARLMSRIHQMRADLITDGPAWATPG